MFWHFRVGVQFSKPTVSESYRLFIENFPRAEKALDELLTKSTFQRFVEVRLHSSLHEFNNLDLM